MAPLMQVDAVTAGYGATVILEQISLGVEAGDAVSVLGRNGVGKTTLLATIMGHTTLHSGSILFGGENISRWPIYRRSAAGIGFVPQEREVFRSLTVHEHLSVAARPGKWDADAVYRLFPGLKSRMDAFGNQLSGGEQQMLAIGRALVTNPSLLLLDEPLEGLAPVVVEELIAALHSLRSSGELTIVLVEQHARIALEFSSRTIIIDHGTVVYEGDSRPLLDDELRLSQLLGFDLPTPIQADTIG